MTYYESIRQAIATIDKILQSNTLCSEVRAEFEASKKNLENLCQYL